MAAENNLLRDKYGAIHAPLVDNTGRAICPRPDWKIEADMLLCTEGKHPSGWLGKAEHLKRMANCLFGSGKRPFQWNPNASRIVEEYFKCDFLAVAGHGSSSKTETMAVIAICEFMADPDNTGVLVSSTTLSEARGRIWGRIEYYWQDLCDYFGGEENTPGELVSSSGIIRYRLGKRKEDTRGIKLVPGKESEVKEGIGRMKGFKAGRMRFFADEMSDLSHKLLEAAESNLFLNPDFKMIGVFNPSSHFDPAGVFSEPVGGWDSINVMESDGWATTRGYCIRFDGERSPNVVAGREIWAGLLTAEKLDDRRKALGDNSPRFVEQYRGAWSTTGSSDSIYTEAEVIKYLGQKKVEVWMDNPVLAGGFDPSFTHGGDRAALVFIQCGMGVSFDKETRIGEVIDTVYLDDHLDTTQDKKEQIVARLIKECKAKGLDPRNLAIDATGGGDVLATLIARDWSNEFIRVQFGGNASEMTLSKTNPRTGKERYANMASELWYSGKELLRCGQLRGLTPGIIREMTKRLYTETGKPPKIKIESKDDMKSRINGKSPDVSDAFFLALHVCRLRLGLASLEKSPKRQPSPETSPVDAMFAWGIKKKPKFNEPDYTAVEAGSGWSDDGASMSMFGL